MPLPPVERDALEHALDTFDSKLRHTDEWLRWEESASQRFALVSKGRRYPPKKIISLATGVPVAKFSGGHQSNEYLLTRGFEVVPIVGVNHQSPLMPHFQVGQVYDRWPHINGPYGGSRQSGISPSARAPAVFLFTGDTGEQYGYRDSFDENGVFSYTGEGQLGDMQLTKGNRSIVDHAKDGRALHVFDSLGKG
jgi:5-methylcytosine-specific restriction protein A